MPATGSQSAAPPASRRALFIVPPTGRFIREDRCQTPIDEMKTIALRPPIDLMYAAAAAEQAGCQCRLVDYPGELLGWSELDNCLREFRPHMLVLSITTPSLYKDVEAARLAKQVDPSILTVAKGAHFNALDMEAMRLYPMLDCVTRGEYEQTCAELATGKALEHIHGITWRSPGGEIVRNPGRPYIEDLDSLPFPARHLTNNSLYFRPDTGELQTTIVTNRGCPYSCVYCLAPVTSGKKNRYRSVDNVLAELAECVERYGIRNFLFRSDLFTQNREWVAQLCQGIVDRRLDIEWASNSRVDSITPETLAWMKKAGCWLIAYGVESGSQQMLDLMNKKATLEQARTALRLTREAGIKSSIYFLMGLPWDTPETLEANVRFAREVRADFVEIFYTYPFPGTEFHRLAIEKGLLKPGETPEDAYSHPAIGGLYMTREQLADWRRKSLRRIYLDPVYIVRTLRSVRSPGELFQYIKYGLLMLKDLFTSRKPKDPDARQVTD